MTERANSIEVNAHIVIGLVGGEELRNQSGPSDETTLAETAEAFRNAFVDEAPYVDIETEGGWFLVPRNQIRFVGVVRD
jgi:hypothetical protein